jgi:hypothetical protein
VEKRTQPISVFHPAKPTPIRNLGHIDTITVLTPQTICKKVTTTEDAQRECVLILSSNGPFVYYGLTEKDYLLLGSYNQDILRYIEQSNQLFDYYRSDTFKDLFVKEVEVPITKDVQPKESGK